MKLTILNGWNFMRALRLVLGILIIVQGFQNKEWTLVVLGGLFSLMPLLNISCCGVAGCNMPFSKSNKTTEEITYEEIY